MNKLIKVLKNRMNTVNDSINWSRNLLNDPKEAYKHGERDSLLGVLGEIQVIRAKTRCGSRVKFFFAWYDMWVGFYWDADTRCLYVCPLPCCVIQIIFKDARIEKGENNGR